MSGKDFDKVSYKYLAEDLESAFYSSFEDADFDAFVDYLEDDECETEIEEDEFR